MDKKGKAGTSFKSDYEEFGHISEARRETLNVLRSSGKSREVNDFPKLQVYLEDAGFHPFTRCFNEIIVNHVDIMEELKSWNLETIFHREVVEEKTFLHHTEAAFYKIQKGYFLDVNVGYNTLDEFEPSVQELLSQLSNRDNLALVSNIILFCPPPSSSLYDEKIEKDVLELVKKHQIVKNTSTPNIAMICLDDGEYYLKDFYIKKDYTIKDGDLHYGPGFMDFHNKLVERFKSESKGLVLFHGLPGTGKTFYIRSFIKDLLKINKYIIYLPPNMVESIALPEMMTFLSTAVLDKAEEGQSCVLLLEDAEPLLASRNTENRSNGITNLLNVTDGLLNDMLSIQVIATFNTELSNIDEALLRPERLIARKEFKKLKVEDARTLASKLGIDKEINEDSSLAEIYSQSKNTEILVHEYSSDERKIGFQLSK